MLISINEQDPLPIYLQIVRQVKEQILVGELCAGDELPSVRDLGDALGISLHTARSAYQVLSDAGLVSIRLGKKAKIAASPASIPSGEMVFRDDAATAMADRFRDVIVDALLLGLDPEAIHALIDRELERLAARRGDAECGNLGSLR